METVLSGTVKLDCAEIEEAVKEYVLKKTGFKMTNWSADFGYAPSNDYYDRGPSEKIFTGVTAVIEIPPKEETYKPR